MRKDFAGARKLGAALVLLTAAAAPTVVAATPEVANPLGDCAISARRERRRAAVIAHRGASGHLPEHTLEGLALAHAMGADFLEQDVVLTRDDQPIVLHDVQLDTVTNVRQVFPDRHRVDGRYYAIDFTLEEIKRLRVHERIDVETGQPHFPQRFPVDLQLFDVPTLSEEIQMIQSLNASTGRTAGIYVEIKRPSWHRRQGKDPTAVVLEVLADRGYTSRTDPCYIQCFEAAELQRIRHQLGCDLRLVQLISPPGEDAREVESGWSAERLAQIAEYADGVGPDLHLLVEQDGRRPLAPTALTDVAHQLGMVVHPYTFRADSLPNFVETFDQLVQLYLDDIGVDGLFTDFPDRAHRLVATGPAPGESTVGSVGGADEPVPQAVESR